jgi:hypothetical protein
MQPGEVAIRVVTSVENPDLKVFPGWMICATIIVLGMTVFLSILSVGFTIVGVLLLALIGFYAYLRYQKSHEILSTDILTNKRAVTLDPMNRVLQSCDLTPDTIVIVSSAFTQNRGIMGGNQGMVNTTSQTYGDVSFIQGGTPLVIFRGIPHPQGVADAAQGVIRSLVASGLGLGPGGMPQMGSQGIGAGLGGYQGTGPFGQPAPSFAPAHAAPSPPPAYPSPAPQAGVTPGQPEAKKGPNYTVR